MEIASIYDYPKYDDVLFGWDRDAESTFYEWAFDLHGVPDDGRLLEVACGTCQVGLPLARRGWQVTGLDRSAEMLAFATAKAAASGHRVEALRADMKVFSVDRPFDAAFNPLTSFRLLLDDQQAHDHLRCMADALTRHGVYLLDMTFGTDGTPEDDHDEWVMQQDGTTVTASPARVEVVDGDADVELVLDCRSTFDPTRLTH